MAATQEANPVSQASQVHAAGHDWTLFVEPEAYIASLIADLQTATTRVWVEVYIFQNDRAGKSVAEALKERARAGVDVRVLYDAIGSQATPVAFFRDLERAGVKVHAFHTFWEALWRFAPLQVLNRRNHRKVVVIDDRVAYFGGMNLADPIAVRGEPRRRLASPLVKESWRDLHVRLTGPQLLDVADSFDRSWRRAQRQRIGPRPKNYRKGLLMEGEESLQFFDSGPGKRYSNVGRVFGQLFAHARRRIDVAMAYFLPVLGVYRQLLAARRRGVRVRVVVPGVSDVPVVRRATRYLYRVLLRRRFRIYERQINMLHSKALVVDDEWTVMGSANLDPRSLLINFEFMAVVHSRPLAAAVKEIIEHEAARSRRITTRDYRRLPWEERLLDRLAWAVRWWL